MVDTGSANEDVVYSKSSALHMWLLGYEFTDTVCVFCSRALFVLTTGKKGAHLRARCLPARGPAPGPCARRDAMALPTEPPRAGAGSPGSAGRPGKGTGRKS